MKHAIAFVVLAAIAILVWLCSTRSIHSKGPALPRVPAGK